MKKYLISLQVGFFLAFRQIKRASIGTTVLIIFIMTLTFLNLVVVNGILVGLLTGSYEQFRDRYSGDILITPQERIANIEKSQTLVSLAKSLGGVEAVSARTVVSGKIRADLGQNPSGKESPNENGGSVVGIDPEDEEKVTGLSDLVLEGKALEPGDEGYILVGASLIKEYSNFADANFPGFTILRGVKVGDKVRLTINGSQNGSAVQISKELIVKGIIKSKVDQVSQRSFVLDSELRKLTQNIDLNVQEIAIKTSVPDTGEILFALKSQTDLSKVRVQTYKEAIPSFLRDIESTFGVLGNVIGGIALVVASITIFIVIFINAVTRRKYIGILKGIGISARAIETAYIFQAIFYGLTGSILGFGLVFLFLKPYFDQNPLDFPFSDGILAASVSGSLARAGVLMLITLLAGFIPARIIVKKNTLDSILGR
ncbi:MAG: ABC transporter permease [Candidatus Doudnabacteria bacterium]|nr:ABC transporter permease [Candidatus Doudnabacteria bacterium]